MCDEGGGVKTSVTSSRDVTVYFFLSGNHKIEPRIISSDSIYFSVIKNFMSFANILVPLFYMHIVRFCRLLNFHQHTNVFEGL